jgi:DNA-binding NarL/FixJ family response regulator
MRVVVANQPRILKECLAVAIGTQNEVEVVVGAANATAILRSVQEFKPDCLILSLEARDVSPRICRTVLSRYPQTLILAIGPKTLTVYWFEMVMRHVRKECSLETILDLLRTKLVERTAKCRPTASAKDCPTARGIPVDILPKREHVCF